MLCVRIALPAVLGVTLAVLVFAGEARQDLAPRTVKFSADKLTLQEALKELQDQTGNVVKDLRKPATNPMVFPKSGTLWPTLDALGKQTGIGFTAYHDGSVALTDTPYRELKHVDYHNIFRFAVTNVAASHNEVTKTHLCLVTLDVAWEPRFQALFLNLDEGLASFASDPLRMRLHTEKMDRQTARSVIGTGAAEIELRMNAPPRKTTEIDSLKGTVRVIGIPHMLEFAFPKLKRVSKPAAAPSVKQDGVTVRLPDVAWEIVNKKTTRISVDVESEYPAGALVKLDSFQEADLMSRNRIWLTWGIDAKTQKPYELEPSDAGPPEGTKRTFYFTPRGNVPLPSSSADVTLRYRTPSRVGAYTAAFEFKNIALP